MTRNNQMHFKAFGQIMTDIVINDFEIYSAPIIKMASEGAIEIFFLTCCEQKNLGLDELYV